MSRKRTQTNIIEHIQQSVHKLIAKLSQIKLSSNVNWIFTTFNEWENKISLLLNSQSKQVMLICKVPTSTHKQTYHCREPQHKTYSCELAQSMLLKNTSFIIITSSIYVILSYIHIHPNYQHNLLIKSIRLGYQSLRHC